MEMSDDAICAGPHERKQERSGDEGGQTVLDEIPAVSPETVFDLLAARQRCIVFSYLENTDDGRAAVSDLVSYVSQHVGVSESARDVLIQLQHVHLPKMAEVGLLEYDRDGDHIQYVGHPLIEDCLDLLEKERRSE